MRRQQGKHTPITNSITNRKIADVYPPFENSIFSLAGNVNTSFLAIVALLQITCRGQVSFLQIICVYALVVS
jgi:hypothetical protein